MFGETNSNLRFLIIFALPKSDNANFVKLHAFNEIIDSIHRLTIIKGGTHSRKVNKYKRKINTFIMLGMGLFDEVFEIITQWKPQKKYPNELKYRDDLMNFIHNKLNNSGNILFGSRNVLVRKEDGRGLCDIAVGNRKVGIELKKDLKSKSQINRLQGQIDDYEEEYEEGVIVVLVGNVNKYVEEELRYRLQKKLDKSNIFGLQQFRIKLINKSDNKIKESKQKSQNIFGFNFNPFG